MAQTSSVLGIDSATLVFHGVGMDESGQVVRRKRIARSALLPFMANVPPLRSGREACGRAHDWARCCREHGHDVRWIAPQLVNASVKSPTHEARDAEASCAAVTRPTRRVVPSTRVEPPDRQARPRIRERLIPARTAWVHEIRGLLNADGLVLPQRLATCRALMVDQLEPDQAQRTALSPAVFWHLDDEFLAVENRLASDAEQRAALGPAHPACQRLQTSPGSGPVSATALIAAIGAVTQGKNGRQLAAWLGVVPREHATGGKPRLRGMSQRGDVDRRQVLGHGARATLRGSATTHDERRPWRKALLARRGQNRAAVALAHQNARIVGALLAHNQEYRSRTAV
jgi:transposase